MNTLSNFTLVELGNDLISAIERAAWLNGKKANLTQPTPHMLTAIANFRAYIEDYCPACDRLGRKT